MNYDELLELLEIDEPEEFQFFEHLAAMMECENHISYEAIFELISKVDKTILSELIENYFDEVSEGLPDDSTETFTFLKSVSLSLRGMLRTLINEEQEGSELTNFVDELERFRNWYIRDSNVECVVKGSGKVKEFTFFDALILSRLEKLNEATEEYFYSFDNSLEYTLSEYTMSCGDVMAAEDEDEGYFEEDLSENPEAEYLRGLEEEEDLF